MKSFESLVMRLSKATLAGHIHHQHCLAGVLGEENLRIGAFKMEQLTNDPDNLVSEVVIC